MENKEERVVGDRARGRGGKGPAANEASCFRENDQRSSKLSMLHSSLTEHSSVALHIYSFFNPVTALLAPIFCDSITGSEEISLCEPCLSLNLKDPPFA